MKRNVIGLVLALGFVLVSPVAAQFADAIDREPLVIYDVLWYGCFGTHHLHLAVYSDGLTSISTLDSAGPHARPHADFAYISEERIGRLVKELIEAGALTLRGWGKPFRWSGRTTVTVFEGSGANAYRNTFSVWGDFGLPPDPYRNVEAILATFIDVVFPPFPPAN